MSVHELLAWKPPILDTIIGENILVAETRMMIFGDAGGWKSNLSIFTAFTIAEGKDWFGYKTTPVNVLRYQSEMPLAMEQDRVRTFTNYTKSFPTNVLFDTELERMKIDTDYGIRLFEKKVTDFRHRCPEGPLLVILDPLYKFMAGHISDEYDVKRFQDNIDELKTKLHLTIIIIHHPRLTRLDASGKVSDLGVEELMGSSYWQNWMDTIVQIKLLNRYSGGDLVAMNFLKVKNAHKTLPNFEVKWSRSNLQPAIVKTIHPEFEEPSIRGGDNE